MRLSLFRGTIGKSIALTLALTFGLELLWPTESHALTGGPSQPEVESFEPIGTTQMVDLYSGDFNYNIPLMTVPGPNGGYPINLAYHAGIGMEQQASWVGLGWNINPGAITRQMRGLPDDFNGDDVTHETYMKPNITVGVDLPGFDINLASSTTEVFGLDLGTLTSTSATGLSVSPTLYYNNYRGVGYRLGMKGFKKSAFTAEKMSSLNESSSIVGKWSLSFDSQKGMGFSAPLSSLGKVFRGANIFDTKLSYNSRQGLMGIEFKQKTDKSFGKLRGMDVKMAYGAGINFANSTYVPTVNYPMRGISTNLKLTFGKESPPGTFKQKFTLPIEYVDNRVPKNKRSRTFDGYGYLNTQNAAASNDDRNLFDFNREKDAAVTRRTPSMYLPVSTHDVFMIQGQGTGGVFRPFRNDIGRYYDAQTISKSTNVNLALEFGAGPPANWKVGADPVIGYTENYAGPWESQMAELNYLDADGYSNTEPLNEPYYFKSNGELTAKPIDYLDNIGGLKPISMNLKTVMGNFVEPRVEDTYHNGGWNTLSEDHRRVIKNQVISYRTKAEVQKAYNYGIEDTAYAHIYTQDSLPWNATDSTLLKDITAGEDHHIHEVSVLNTDGTRYVYGLPAYNQLHEDYTFALGDNDLSALSHPYSNPNTIGYNTADVAQKNGNGQDHFYHKTSLPPYAHAYMLTSIFSHDYVDLKGDGPSQDDLGYYTKFNYVDPHGSGSYEWRTPLGDKKANYMKGTYSNQQDDKASFSYGKKDIYYVHSIETKTHIAMFELGDREDGKGATGLHDDGTTTAKRLKYLRSITLYSKNDLNTPIKKVHFVYDYSLCQGLPNNDGTAPTGSDLDHIIDNDDGKLTLQKVFFTYLGNDKGRLSPFEFDYKETDVNHNPGYSERQMDRWGNYQPENLYANMTSANNVNPYTYQGTYTNRNNAASVWCLKTISLPSGGDININYEADDYGHVQNKRAMQMCEILGFQNVNETAYDNITAFNNGKTDRIRKKNRRVYFRMTDTTVNVSEYVSGLANKRETYFKTWQRLKRKPADLNGLGQWSYDYIDGYCEIIENSAGRVGSTDIGFFDIAEDKYGVGDVFPVHPFRMAGWQHIRYQRPDLFPPSNEPGGGAASFISAVPNFLAEAMGLIIGYYNKAASLGYCDRLQLDGISEQGASLYQQPSFIRLNAPNHKKYGGGCRVSKIAMTDNWDAVEGSAASYGQEYKYCQADDTTKSSGVADYEPLIGGEENPFRKPVWYNGNEALIAIRNNDVYIEEPYGESYFPGANVGYSRVEVRSLENDSVTRAHDGVVVNEFYTSKDFPTIVTTGKLQHKGFNLPVIIPFIGGIDISSNGYSQGYTIELNDMSGKPKMVTTYKYGTDFTENPVSQTEYTYHTSAVNSHKLENRVQVLEGDGQVNYSYMGINHDFIMDEREHSTVSASLGIQANVDGAALAAVPTALPAVEIRNSMFRSVGSTKVIYRTGILKEVRNFTDGATIRTNNLLYDAVTGNPLLTSVTNEFKEPVYTYSFPAHWNYEGMNGAWKNLGAVFELGTYNATDGYPVTSATVPTDSLFFVGDQVQLYDANNDEYETYYVYSVDDQGIFLEDETGNNIVGATGYTGTIKRSGRRNHLGTNSGTIVSLSNPLMLDTDVPSFFSIFNDNVGTGEVVMNDTSFTIAGTGCDGVRFSEIKMDAGSLSSTRFVFSVQSTYSPGLECGGLSGLYVNVDIDDFDFSAVHAFNLASWDQDPNPLNGSIELVNLETGQVYTTDWVGNQGCYGTCPQVILHADATEFCDTCWAYNYTDVGSPEIRPNGGSLVALDHTTGYGEHRYGQRGVWRAKRSNVYLIDRLQTNTGDHKTKVDLDGEYNSFTKFKWNDPTTSHNEDWEWTTEITKYSPYGFELENKDRLEIYSGEMYGYDNSVVTMVGSNSQYHEMAFDGFEDYTGTSLASADHGHFEWKMLAGNVTLSTAEAHSGDYSVLVKDGTTAKHLRTVSTQDDYIIPIVGKPYVVTAWIYTGDGGDATVQVVSGASTFSKSSSATDNVTIDGWTRVQVDVTTFESGSPDPVDIQVINSSGTDVYLDDIRLQPKVGAMKTFVYDPATLWLVAEQDNFGFTTYYNYDEEGTLVQVKQETERGIITLSTSRQNTKQTP